MNFPKRSRDEAHRVARMVMVASLSKSIHYIAEIDGCSIVGAPAIGVRIKNELGEECITWDSFCELWLRNVECDEPFVSKPQLLRRK